jgi:nucleotide-binding universal stress UspA family protein
MAFPYQKILCPVTFDDSSMRALEQAIGIAGHFKATMILVHIVLLVGELSGVPVPFDLIEEEERVCRTKLEKIGIQKLAGIDHEFVVRSGDVAYGILRAIEQYSPDLLVMATHGRKGLAHFFLSSVAELMVRKASCPVLTIRSEPAGPT